MFKHGTKRKKELRIIKTDYAFRVHGSLWKYECERLQEDLKTVKIKENCQQSF